MNLIDRIQAINNNEVEYYCYVFELKLKTKNNKYLSVYTVGVSEDRPEQHLIDIVKSIYLDQNYIPECHIHRIRKTPLAYQLMYNLKKVLRPYLQNMGTLEFIGVDSCYKECLIQFDEIIPYIEDDEYQFNEFLPNWAYHPDELQSIKDKAIEYNEVGYLS